MLTLGTATGILGSLVGNNQDVVQRINLVCAYYLDAADPVGSLEKVTFVVTSDANGEGFITLPNRYDVIRGAVENPCQTSTSGVALEVRNDYYEYAPGNMSMITSSDSMRGIVPIPLTQSDTTTYLDAGLVPRKWKVPACPSTGSQTFFTVICKRAFIFLENDNDILPVQNLHALAYGLKALDKRDAEDYVREDELWEKGKARLAAQLDNQTGSEALGKVQMEDDFSIGCLSDTDDYGWGGWYGYNSNPW